MPVGRKSIEPYISDDLHYYQHQIDGIRRMINMRSVLLADDMGLGKSLQALSLFAIDVHQGYSEKLLIVCPASLKANWENEIRKFTKNISVMRISKSSTQAAKFKSIRDFVAASGPRAFITNYEQVPGLLIELKKIRWDMIIFDEAHMIKNPKAKRTQAAHSLDTRRSILITGSPILNHANDLWSLLYRIAPNDMESYYRFITRYCVYGGWKNKQIIGIKNEHELNARLTDVMVRRLKEDVLDLPEVLYTTRMVELLPKQGKLYNEVVSNMQLTDAQGEVEEIDNALTKFLRLKQICGTSAIFTDNDESAKLDAAEYDAVDLIVNQGQRVVAFTQFRGVQQAYEQRMLKAAMAPSNNSISNRKAGIPAFPVFVLNGDIDIDDRQEIVNQWSNSEKPGIIICMYQVAGVGLNMVASRNGQLLDKLVTPELNKQAVDRMHRIGADKTQPVTIIEYRAKDTAEDRVEQIIDQKKKVNKQLLETDETYKLAVRQAIKEEIEEKSKLK